MNFPPPNFHPFDQTPEQIFASAANASKEHDPDKAIAIALWTGPDGKRYDFTFLISGMTVPETIGLLEVIKAYLIDQLNLGRKSMP